MINIVSCIWTIKRPKPVRSRLSHVDYTKMIKAIIFDCFGVLVESTYGPFKDKYFSSEPELIKEFTALEQLSSAGYMDYATLNKEFARLAGIPLERAIKELSAQMKNEDLLSLISDLKTKYKIGFLSNVATDILDRMFVAEDLELFDDIILSYQVGLAKPDQKIYKLAADRLGIETSDCLFIDDNVGYLYGAEEVGMKTLLYRDFKSFSVDLRLVLDNEFIK